jgi:hypothetical protein
MPIPVIKTEPVSPTGVCRLADIAAFREGEWNGEKVTLADMKAMVDNFKQFSSGPEAYYKPFVSLNHDDALNVGFVDGCRLDADGVLKLDGANIPDQVGEWVKGNRLHAPSIEFWRPKYEGGKLVGSFMRPDGKYSETPVLKCVTLLGNDAPAVKGLGPLPEPTPQPSLSFADVAKAHGWILSPVLATKLAQHGKPIRFGSKAMDRATIISTLQKMGFDTSQITDAVPDAVLQAMLAFVQGMAQPGGTAAATPPPTSTDTATPAMADKDGKDKDKDKDAPVMCADLSAPVVTAGTPAPTATPSGTAAAPSSITLKFSDSAGRVQTVTAPLPPELVAYQNSLQSTLALINGRANATAADLKRQRDALKNSEVAAFSERMKGRYTPYQLGVFRSMLLTLDHDTARKFADGKTTGTAFQEAVFNLEAAAPPAKGEKIKADPAVGGGNPTPFAERQKKILESDPLFMGKKEANAKKAGAAA